MMRPIWCLASEEEEVEEEEEEKPPLITPETRAAAVPLALVVLELDGFGIIPGKMQKRAIRILYVEGGNKCISAKLKLRTSFTSFSLFR